jgi:hypothetical protein
MEGTEAVGEGAVSAPPDIRLACVQKQVRARRRNPDIIEALLGIENWQLRICHLLLKT